MLPPDPQSRMVGEVHTARQLQQRVASSSHQESTLSRTMDFSQKIE